mmetsp:Transcript_18725/g.40572  ORF Transcript_18725/g.40572 Transcript_18725/m.40572 type:complete len:207 (+) Transcript_18725:890-1510(+)
MEIHYEMYNFLWQISTNIVHYKRLIVDNLDMRAVIVTNWLVHVNVHLSPPIEIFDRSILISIFVIRSIHVNALNILFNEFLLITYTLQNNDFAFQIRQHFSNMSPPLVCRVCRIKYSHTYTILLHKLFQIRQSSITSLFSFRHVFVVGMIKEISRKSCTVQTTAIISNIKDPCIDVKEEGEVTNDTVGNVCFACGGETTHDDDEFL